MRGLVKTAACAALIIGLAGAGVAERHMRMTKSKPEADTVVPTSPAVIQAWFNQAPELALSRLAVEGPDGSVELGDVRAGEEFSLISDVPASLRPGSYTVRWRTAGDDGHVVRGDFSFTVGATGSN
jgi:methionine-rich copper-binding protein CopC